MRQIINKMIKMLHVEYRMTVVKQGKFINICGLEKRTLIKRASLYKGDYWSLYKKGPFFIGERLVAERKSQ